jgi:hypothetical protein
MEGAFILQVKGSTMATITISGLVNEVKQDGTQSALAGVNVNLRIVMLDSGRKKTEISGPAPKPTNSHGAWSVDLTVPDSTAEVHVSPRYIKGSFDDVSPGEHSEFIVSDGSILVIPTAIMHNSALPDVHLETSGTTCFLDLQGIVIDSKGNPLSGWTPHASGTFYNLQTFNCLTFDPNSPHNINTWMTVDNSANGSDVTGFDGIFNFQVTLNRCTNQITAWIDVCKSVFSGIANNTNVVKKGYVFPKSSINKCLGSCALCGNAASDGGGTAFQFLEGTTGPGEAVVL